MAGYALFDPFSDLAIAGPRKSKIFQKLSKLVVVHSSKLKPAMVVIQGNKLKITPQQGAGNALAIAVQGSRSEALAKWRTGVMGYLEN
jgi:hypothetical protein